MVDEVKLLLAEYSKLRRFQQEQKRVLSSQIAQLLSTSHKYLTLEEMDQVPRIYKYAQMLARSSVTKTTISNIKNQSHPASALFEQFDKDRSWSVFLFSLDQHYWIITLLDHQPSQIWSAVWFVDAKWVLKDIQWQSYGIVMYIAANEFLRPRSLWTNGNCQQTSRQVWTQLCKLWLAESESDFQSMYTADSWIGKTRFTQSLYDHRAYQWLLDNELVTDKRVTFTTA